MIDPLPPWPLFGFSDDARPALRTALEAGGPAALATIVALGGGGPRPVGTQMVIAKALVSGFLSGGCLEADVAGHARAVLADGAPRRLIYGEGSPWPDIRLLCGARIEIQLERITPDDEAARRLFAFRDARAPAIWLSDGTRRICEPATPEPGPGPAPCESSMNRRRALSSWAPTPPPWPSPPSAPRPDARPPWCGPRAPWMRRPWRRRLPAR